jgi:transcription elongation factor Elf1
VEAVSEEAAEVSYKIGHKHVHARDDAGYTGCHAEPCGCARCLLETGAEIPKDLRAQVERFREHTSEMYKCDKCGGLKVALIGGDEKHKIPSTLWCMTCGKSMMASRDTSTRLVKRLGVEEKAVSLRDRLSGSQVGVNETSRGRVPSQAKMTTKQPGREWTPEERRDLKVLIDKHGVGAGSRAYLAKYPDRGRTEQGCAYQYHTKISKGEGI